MILDQYPGRIEPPSRSPPAEQPRRPASSTPSRIDAESIRSISAAVRRRRPEALDRLVESAECDAVSISFEYRKLRVAVDADGTPTLSPLQDRD